MTETQFAKHVGRDQRTVSNWLRRGKISREAIINGKIDPERAAEDLALSLDTRRNNHYVRPIGIPNRRAVSAELDRRRRAETEIAESKAQQASLQFNIESKKWISVEEFERQCGKELSKFIADQESFLLNTLAKRVAAKNNLDCRIVATFIRQHWRKFRARYAQRIEAEITALR